MIPEAAWFAQAMLRNGALQLPARRLGSARARQGVGVDEAMGDLCSVFVAADAPVDVGVLRELVAGWVLAYEQDHASSCTDVATGLSTAEHFARVVHDAYVSTTREGSKKVLARVLFLDESHYSHADWALLAEIRHVCSQTLGTGIPAFLQRRGELHFLMEGTGASYTRVELCRDRIDALRDGTIGPSALTFRPLPTSEDEAMRFTWSLKNGHDDHLS